jgi:predicted transglutaminase-like cysteine proteinase
MRQTTKALAVTALAVATCWTSASQAGFFSYPRAMEGQLNRMNLQKPTLGPMAQTVFCLRYKEDCEVRGGEGSITMTVERLNELNSVNRQVNRDIVPQPNIGDVASETWIVSPRAGACHDYAVTKRHELLAQGWPSSALLLSEVVIPSGEHHLVLVARMQDPDAPAQVVNLVLDNLNYNLRPVGLTPYRWVRMETAENPKFWSTVSVSSSSRAATLAD